MVSLAREEQNHILIVCIYLCERESEREGGGAGESFEIGVERGMREGGRKRMLYDKRMEGRGKEVRRCKESQFGEVRE